MFNVRLKCIKSYTALHVWIRSVELYQKDILGMCPNSQPFSSLRPGMYSLFNTIFIVALRLSGQSRSKNVSILVLLVVRRHSWLFDLITWHISDKSLNIQILTVLFYLSQSDWTIQFRKSNRLRTVCFESFRPRAVAKTKLVAWLESANPKRHRYDSCHKVTNRSRRMRLDHKYILSGVTESNFIDCYLSWWIFVMGRTTILWLNLRHAFSTLSFLAVALGQNFLNRTV
jgi:hypothetical protein